MNEQIYGDERARRLVELLRGLGARIEALRSDDELLAAGPELMDFGTGYDPEDDAEGGKAWE